MEEIEERRADGMPDIPDLVKLMMASMLSPEDAFKLSVLSPEWSEFSYTLPNLKLNETHFLEQSSSRTVIQFKHMIDQFLMNDRRSKIEAMELSVGLGDNVITGYNLNKWVERVLELGVSHLSLNQLSQVIPTDILPSELFVSKTLLTLKLCNFVLTEPPQFCLPSLRSLNLERFSSSSLEFTQNLIDGCDALLELSLVNVHGPSLPVLVISSNTLRVLKMQHVRFAKKICVFAPNLQELIYCGNTPPVLCHMTMNSVKKLELNIILMGTVNTSDLVSLFQGPKGLVDLKMQGDTFRALISNQEFVSNFPMRRKYVRNLELHVRQWPEDITLLSHMLNCFPNVRDIKLSFQSHWYKSPVAYQILEGNDSENHQHQEIGQFQGYVFDSLEEVQIESFACEDEYVLKLIESLVKNSRNLQKMVIRYSHSIGSSSEFRQSITMRILGFPRASAQSVLFFL